MKLLAEGNSKLTVDGNQIDNLLIIRPTAHLVNHHASVIYK